MAKEPKREITPFMRHVIYTLEELGFQPKPVPEGYNRKNPKNYIVMQACDENGNALSTIVLDLTLEGQNKETRDYMAERVKRQKAALAPRIKKMSKEEIEEMKAAIQVKNQLLGLQDVSSLSTKYKRAKTMETTKAAKAAAANNGGLGRK